MSTKTPPESAARAPSDDEIDAMRACLKQLDKLTIQASIRVVCWLDQRLSERLPAEEQEL